MSHKCVGNLSYDRIMIHFWFSFWSYFKPQMCQKYVLWQNYDIFLTDFGATMSHKCVQNLSYDRIMTHFWFWFWSYYNVSKICQKADTDRILILFCENVARQSWLYFVKNVPEICQKLDNDTNQKNFSWKCFFRKLSELCQILTSDRFPMFSSWNIFMKCFMWSVRNMSEICQKWETWQNSDRFLLTWVTHLWHIS